MGVGVAYGAVNQSRLTKKEAKIQEVEQKQKAIRNAKLAEEKRIAAEKELKELEEMAK